jgi:hypothetical protein
MCEVSYHKSTTHNICQFVYSARLGPEQCREGLQITNVLLAAGRGTQTSLNHKKSKKDGSVFKDLCPIMCGADHVIVKVRSYLIHPYAHQEEQDRDWTNISKG